MSARWSDDIVACPRCHSLRTWSAGACRICSGCGNAWKPCNPSTNEKRKERAA